MNGHGEHPGHREGSSDTTTTYSAPLSGPGAGAGVLSGSSSGTKVTFAFGGTETDQRLGFLASNHGGMGGAFQGGFHRPPSTELPLSMVSRGVGGGGFLGVGGGPLGAPPLQSLFCASPSMPPRTSLGPCNPYLSTFDILETTLTLHDNLFIPFSTQQHAPSYIPYPTLTFLTPYPPPPPVSFI